MAASERLNTTAPELAIFPAIEPAVLPFPISSVPPETVVSPVYVLFAASVSRPGPAKVRLPVPLIVPVSVTPSRAFMFTPERLSAPVSVVVPVVVNVWSV